MSSDEGKIDDGFGDNAEVIASTEAADLDLLAAPGKHREPIPTEGLETLGQIKPVFGAWVPEIKVHSGHGPVVGGALPPVPESAYAPDATELRAEWIELPATKEFRSELDNEPDGVTGGVEHNIQALASRLIGIGWRKHPQIIDRWTAPNDIIACEMGYAHKEVWVRAIETGVGAGGATAPLWTKRIYGWGTRAARETLQGIFSDLENLGAGLTTRVSSEVTEDFRTELEREVHARMRIAQRARTIGFALLTPNSKLPTRTYPDDAGFDLYVVEDTWIEGDSFVDVPLGVSVGLPKGVWGRVTGRSSTLRNSNLLVNEGIIDTGYTGPLFAGCRNLGGEGVLVRGGDRIAQLILHDNVTMRFTPGEVIGHPETERGTAGFGSSGR